MGKLELMRQDRRTFLASAMAAAATAVPFSRALADEKPAAATDRLTFALIGAGGQGTAVAKQALEFGELAAIADVDLRQARKANAALGAHAKIYQDYRRLLERQDIDAIINATPDHWHTAINIDACRAGKDLYAEKPLSLTIDEGKILNRVVADTNRVVQVGTQQRSNQNFQTAVELVRNGRIGKLRRVAVLLPFWSTKGGPFAEQPVPDELDWDMYQGQAPLRPYHPRRTAFDFRWWW